MNDHVTLKSIDPLPQPRGLPWLGSALQMDASRLHLQLEAWAQELGSYFCVRAAGRRFLIVNDPTVTQGVLRERPDGYRRIRTLEPVAKDLGMNGLFSSEGERWRAQRRLWLATLNTQQLRSFHEQLQLITRKLMLRWQRAADREESVDITADLMRYTIDVTMQFALGHPADTLEKGDDVIQRHLDKIFPALGQRVRGFFPYWRYFKLPRDHALDRALAALRTEVGALIEQARGRMLANPSLRESPTCFLEAFIAAHERDGAAISDEDVFANTMTVLLGGEDTTANTMAWLMHCLSTRPEIYAALRSEADAFLDDPAAPDREVPRADRFPHLMRITDAVINETLRLYPIAPFFLLESLRDNRIGEYAVPAGTQVILLTRSAVGCSPLSRPPPHFDPLADAAKTDAGPARAVTLPFGYGPRMCPGRNLALAELRSATLMLVRNFDLEAVPGVKPVSERLNFTLAPEHLRLRFRLRAA